MKRLVISLVLMLALALPATATVNSSTNRTVVLGNGSQTAFTFNFIGVAAAYLNVLLTDSSGTQTALTQGSGTNQYTITLNPAVQGAIWGLGGTVTYNPSGTPIPAGSTLTIYRTLPLTQAVNLQNLSSIAVLGKGAETGLDTGVMQGQQISETNSRAIVANIANSAAPLPLPPAAQIANQGICADSTGLNLIGCALPASGVISTAMQPVVNAATLALGRAAFGLGSMATENINSGSCGGNTLQDDGSGNARVVFGMVSDSTNQTVTCAYSQTQRIATGPIVYNLPRSNTLFAGWGFKIYIAAGTATFTPNANDNFQGMASGVSVTTVVGSVCSLTTSLSSSGVWQISCNNSTPSLSSSASGNALTLTLNGTVLNFRDQTIANGDPLSSLIPSALSVTIPSGATLGTSNNSPFRLWIFAAYNNGTPVLGVATCSNQAQVFGCSAWELMRRTSTGISSGATSPGILYTSTGVTNDTVRIIGFADYSSGLSTAGTWASTPTLIQLCISPFSCPRPGSVVQSNYFSRPTTQTTSGAAGPATTALTTSFALTSTPNLVKSAASVSSTAGSGVSSTVQMYRSVGAFGCSTAVGQPVSASAVSSWNIDQSVIGVDTPFTTSPVSYGLCFSAGGGNITINGGMILIEEIMGSIENASKPLRMVG